MIGHKHTLVLLGMKLDIIRLNDGRIITFDQNGRLYFDHAARIIH